MLRRLRKLNKAYVLIALLVVAFLVTVLWWYFSRPSQRQESVIPSSSSDSTKSAKKTTSDSSVTPPSAGASSTKSTASGSAVNTSLALLPPWGSFVSNHHPGQNGSPITETSACNTTPGATCYIKFTNGDKVRSLTSKTADSNGSVIWSWDTDSAGFSSGSWQITATASLNGQIKSTQDSQALVIQ